MWHRGLSRPSVGTSHPYPICILGFGNPGPLVPMATVAPPACTSPEPLHLEPEPLLTALLPRQARFCPVAVAGHRQVRKETGLVPAVRMESPAWGAEWPGGALPRCPQGQGGTSCLAGRPGLATAPLGATTAQCRCQVCPGGTWQERNGCPVQR